MDLKEIAEYEKQSIINILYGNGLVFGLSSFALMCKRVAYFIISPYLVVELDLVIYRD